MTQKELNLVKVGSLVCFKADGDIDLQDTGVVMRILQLPDTVEFLVDWAGGDLSHESIRSMLSGMMGFIKE